MKKSDIKRWAGNEVVIQRGFKQEGPDPAQPIFKRPISFSLLALEQKHSAWLFFSYIDFHGSPRRNSDLHIITYMLCTKQNKTYLFASRPSKQSSVCRCNSKKKSKQTSDVTGCLPSFSSYSVALGQMSLGSSLVLSTPITWKRNATCLLCHLFDVAPKQSAGEQDEKWNECGD